MKQVFLAVLAALLAVAFAPIVTKTEARSLLVGVPDGDNGCIPVWEGTDGTVVTYATLAGLNYLGSSGAKNVYEAPIDSTFSYEKAIIPPSQDFTIVDGEQITLIVWGGCTENHGQPVPTNFTVLTHGKNYITLGPPPEGNWEVRVKIGD